MNAAASTSYCCLPIFSTFSNRLHRTSLHISLHPINKRRRSLSTSSPSPAVRPVRRCRRRRLTTTRSSISFPQNLGSSRDSGLFQRLISFLPGGNWWNLEQIAEEEEGKQVNVGARKEGADDHGERSLPALAALGRMWALVSKDRWIVFLAFASLFLASLSDISIPHFLAASIFSAQSGESVTFYKNAKVLILLCFSSGICSGLRGCCFGIANMILVKQMREKLYYAILYQDMSFFDEETVGDLTSRLGADCQQVSQVIGYDLNLICRNVLQGSGALIYLFILSWPLALSTLAICSVLGTIMLIYGRYQKTAAKLTQEFTAGSNEVSQETLSSIRTVRVYGTEKHEFGRYLKWLERLFGISLRQSLAYGYWNLSFTFLYHSTQVIAVLIGGISILSGRITAEQLTKFVMYTEWLIYSTWRVGDNWSTLMQSIGASEKVFRLMDLQPTKQFLSEGRKLQKLVGIIDFVNVSFHYPSRMTIPALQHVNLLVHPNEIVAIVGLSGSGKSTLVSLLLRLYEPTDGQILIDGIPLGELDIRWLREKIGFVGQEPRLFRMDVASNIKYGCPKEVSHEEVEWAAKQAFAHEFIMSLPNGYDTLVDNSLLSGGQKQRIAIARAILRDPTILVLDEATSALDAESEHYVKGILRNSKAQRSVIVIAHRLSTIQAADRIVVMDSGRIVEMGDHAELIKRDGLYSRLAKRQADALA